MRKTLLLLAILLLAGCLLAAQTTSSVYIVAAQYNAVTDSTGRVWQPDTGLFSLGTASNYAPLATVTGTPDPMLYKGARIGSAMAPMVYTIGGLASGTYQVTLYMAECYYSAAGSRVFNVQMQNLTVLANVDIFQAAGKNVAYTQTAMVSVVDTLTIAFVPIAGKNVPLINAIQVSPSTSGGGGHTVTLTWADDINPAGSVEYNVYKATGLCSDSSSFTKIAQVPGFTYADNTIVAQQGYCYQVKAMSITDGTESLPCRAVYLPGSVSSCNCQ